MKSDIKKKHVFNKRWTDAQIEDLANDLIKWYEAEENIWLGSFATQHKISRQRISEFAKKNSYFKECYQLALSIQESKLVERGLNKKATPVFEIFILKAKHNWRETQEETSTVQNITIKLPEQINDN